MSSADYWVVLFGPPPSLEWLNNRLEAFGGVDGTWNDCVTCAGVDATLERSDAQVANALAVIAGRRHPPLVALVELSGPSSSALESFGEALVGGAGGAFISQDECELIKYAAQPDRKIASKTAQGGSTTIDVSVPPAVQQMFGIVQKPFKVVGRTIPKLKFSQVARKLGASPTRYPSHSAWDSAKIGSLVLKEYGAADLEYYKGEFANLGINRPISLVALTFEHWHVKSAPDWEWNAMTAILCAFARDTHGLMYLPDSPNVAYDFESPPPPEEVLTLTWHERGHGALLKIHSTVVLKYVVREIDGTEIDRSSQFGRSGTLIAGNTLLERILVGARVGCSVIAQVPTLATKPDLGGAQLVPRCPSDRPFHLELAVVEKLD
jgi:hypothetical protein